MLSLLTKMSKPQFLGVTIKSPCISIANTMPKTRSFILLYVDQTSPNGLFSINADAYICASIAVIGLLGLSIKPSSLQHLNF
jgi:hypothetical protein